MKGTNIGEFEELVMLSVGILQEEAYGISIKDELEVRTQRKPSIGALHSALSRLEKKGLLKSFLEGPTEDRRGRRKRYYQLTQSGKEVLAEIYEQRKEMIHLIPNLIFKS